jgi:hypothetical protein
LERKVLHRMSLGIGDNKPVVNFSEASGGDRKAVLGVDDVGIAKVNPTIAQRKRV